MLKPVRKNAVSQPGGVFAIVAAQFNAEYVDSMVKAATAVLRKSKAREIKIVRVPGAFEIPVVAARLAHDTLQSYSAILTFGVIMRGETTHAHYIADGVTHALANLQISSGIPIIHGVYLFEDAAQAEVRCLSPRHNRGTELGQVALAMAAVMKTL